MARYEVWVSHPDSQDRVDLHAGDDGKAAADLVYALVLNSGAAEFDVGISIGKAGETAPPPPPPVEKPPAPPAEPPSVTQGGRRRTHGVGQ